MMVGEIKNYLQEVIYLELPYKDGKLVKPKEIQITEFTNLKNTELKVKFQISIIYDDMEINNGTVRVYIDDNGINCMKCDFLQEQEIQKINRIVDVLKSHTLTKDILYNQLCEIFEIET